LIRLDNNITIGRDELKFDFIRSSGPGGQNVNKVATAAQLRFNAAGSPSLPEDVRQRLISAAGKKINSEGILVIEAKRYRTQDKNRQDAIARLKLLLQKALSKPKKRVKTKPSPASNIKRITDKKKTAEKKQNRRFTDF